MMTEHSVRAIVLEKSPSGEADIACSLLVGGWGKITARVVSARKITSKLSAHLEPGSIVRIRLVRRTPDSRFRLVEALAEKRTGDPGIISFLNFIGLMLPIEGGDDGLFSLAEKLINDGGKLPLGTYRRALKAMGYDPSRASCSGCGSEKIAYFNHKDIIFLCGECRKNIGHREKAD